MRRSELNRKIPGGLRYRSQGRERRTMIKLPQSKRGKGIAVAVLAVCAAALCKPLGWLGYLASGTVFFVLTWILQRILPTLAAFIAGPVGAVVVSFGAVFPMFFTYKPYREEFRYNALHTVSIFLAFSAFSCVFYIFAKRGGAKNLMLGLLCGTLDQFLVGMLCSVFAIRTVDKTTPIPLFPIIACFLAALAAHVLGFLLRRREKAAEEE